jgi:hypothetical protein
MVSSGRSTARFFQGRPNRQRSWDCLTLRSFIPAPQVNPGCPGGSNPACRFMNVRPDVFYAGGSIANLVYSLQSIDQGTFIPTSGIGIYPVRKRTR